MELEEFLWLGLLAIYVTDNSVMVHDHASTHNTVVCWVPQGSVL